MKVVDIARREVPKIAVILCAEEDEVVMSFDLIFESFDEAYKYFKKMRDSLREEAGRVNHI